MKWHAFAFDCYPGFVFKMNELFLNTEEAAELVKRTPSAMRNLVMRKAIPYRKPGGRLIFLKSELDEWIKSAPGVTIEELKGENY